MYLRFLKLIAALILLLSTAVFARQNNTPTKGAIEGAILNDSTGEPIPEAEVRLGVFVGRSSTPPPPGVTEITPDAPGIPVVTTGPDGRFSFNNINAGTYRVVATANGFIRQEYGQKTPYGVGKPVYVAEGQTLKDTNVRLLGAGAVSGRIVQDAGRPALGATVWVFHPIFSAQGRNLTSVGTATVDDRGEFRLFGIAPGRYYMAAGTSPESGRQFVAVGNPNQSRTENYAIAYYPGVPEVDHATIIDVRPSMDSRVDMRLTKRTEYHIRGRVSDATTGSPPDRAQIDLLFYNFAGFNMGMPTPVVYDAATGNFDLSGIPPGEYMVRARGQAPSRPPDLTDSDAIRRFMEARARQPLAQTVVTVTSADVEGISLVISPGVSVPGSLIVEGQPATDLSRFSIRLSLVSYGQRLLGTSPDTPPMSPDGTFSFPNIQEGDYVLQLFSLASNFYLKSVTSAGVDVRNRPFRIGGKVEPIEVTVQRGTGTLPGAVTDVRNNPVSGIPVALVPDQRNLVDNYRIGLTGQDGRFSISNIPPGRYKVFSWEVSEQGAYFDPDFVGLHENQGRSVLVVEGTNSSVDVKLIPAMP